ncbi:MAG: sodium:solute symporter family protein, partial [Dehalococcoidales bacterium]|nr:sodium:solute symporter family protein [Dehalococcoidales bacterium]
MFELIVIAIYFVVMLTIGLLSKRDIKKPDDFFVTNRQTPTVLVAGSLLATIIGGSATVGMAGLGFTRGLTGSWWLLSGTIGLLVLGIFFAKKVRRFALYTLPQLVEKQYGRNMALAASILIVISWMGIIAAQIIAAGKILGILQIGSPVLWMVLFTVVFVTYTAIGGQYSVIRTDIIQSAVIFIGVLAGLGVLLSRLGGWSGLQAALPAGQFGFPVSPKFGAADLISMLLIVGLTYVVGPDMYSRLFCTRDEKGARTAVLWAAVLMVPLAFAITLMGMGAAALFPKIGAEAAFPTIIKEVFSPIVGSIVIAALISAVMSSADTTLLSASTIFIVDIVGWFRPQQKNILPHSRWLIVLLGAGSL